MKSVLISTLGAAVFMMAGQAVAGKIDNASITIDEVKAAQQAWGDALVKISTTHDEQGIEAAKKLAKNVLDGAYGYEMGPVLFKPTLASGEQTFRTTYDGALSYFVGHDSNFAQDSGFALKNWRGFEFENAAVFMEGDMALTMGHVHVTNASGEMTTVDKTWGFMKDDEGVLRIVLHHSSLPYAAAE